MRMYQTATYWPKGERDGFGGVQYPESEFIKVRWEDKQELFTNDKGERDLSRSIVYTNIDMEQESYLYLGESSEANPLNELKAFKIKAISVTPNLTNTKKEIKVWL